MIGETIFLIGSVGAFALLITAALSPLETLSWWAGWREDEIKDETPDPSEPSPKPETTPATSALFIVYLSGIATISGRYLITREKTFLHNLQTEFPDAKIISDVFPYSPRGLPLLAAQRFFDRLWRWFQQMQIEGRSSILSLMINTRNVFQVMISADHRYGPIFNQGAARVIENRLRDAGVSEHGNPRIIVIGYSGGAQIAAGAAGFLKTRLDTPIEIISIGGVMASDSGLHFVRRLHHFHGTRDRVEKIGAIFFPERWSLMAHSEWNHGKRDGRFALHKLDGMGHAGPTGYFGLPKQGATSNNERMVSHVAAAIRDRPAV